ncbi:MAG: hypothetical protein LUI13_10090, partial [Lachnospiraceae bacterium]|nr:hypothetical protein [Lachnospiraceae bacterium]
MGNENLLPKNIRQIGEIQGRQKICLEDYVVTYIRKIESRGDENFLGIFLGERKNTEQADYVFVRGLMEVPDAKEQKSWKTAADGVNTNGQGGTPAGENAKIRNRKDAETDGAVDARFDGKQVAAEKVEEYEAADEDITKEKISLWEAFQRRYGTQEAGNTEKGEKEDKEAKKAKKANEAKNTKKAREAKEAREARDVMPDGSLNAQERNCADSADPAVEPQDIWEQLRKELEERFPGCEILGCCVIGAYPAGRTEELSSHFPEAGQMLYHLQDQEERLYWRDGGRYEGVKGYFVFYEQNRQMQAYLAETFGGASVEKEKVPDEAIRSFREKVKSKAEERSRSFLKLASSFFVVGVLIIGVVMVNRVADLRQVQSVAETVGVISVTGESGLDQSDSDSADSRELDLGNTDTETADA